MRNKKKEVKFRYIKNKPDDCIHVQFKGLFFWKTSRDNKLFNSSNLEFKNKEKAMSWILDQFDLKPEAMSLIEYPSIKII